MCVKQILEKFKEPLLEYISSSHVDFQYHKVVLTYYFNSIHT